MKAITFPGVIEEIYDDHTGLNPVRLKVSSETMLFETYVPADVGRKLKASIQLINLCSEVFRDTNAGGSIIKGPSAWRFRDGGYGNKK